MTALIALVISGELISSGGSATASSPAFTGAPVTSFHQQQASSSAPQPVVVDVVGAVRRRGVVRLPGQSRVRDAIRAAGGATAHANLDAINLAQLLADGEQIVVPTRDAATRSVTPSLTTNAHAVLHLNSASAGELDALDGIGPALAQRIVDYRVAHGGFRSIDELDQVSGIGATRLEALRGHVAP